MTGEPFLPETEQQALELVQWAVSGGKTVSIQGTNTKQGFGLPVNADCVMSMERLSGILEYHPEELVMAALPGTSLAEITGEMEKHKQRLAFEPPALNRMYQAGDGGTIGGVFMGNLAGPRRFAAGSARDHILGVRAVNGRAEVWKSGGKVIKNVSGYDMSKLLAGSWGTLSAVTELTFKVLPAPPASLSLAAWGLSPGLGMALLTRVASTPCEATGLAYLPAAALAAIRQDEISLPGGSLTLVRLEGTESSVNERLRSMSKWLPSPCEYNVFEQAESELAWSWIRDAAPLADPQHTPMILKLSLPPASALDLTRFIEELRGCTWYLDAAGGWLWVGLRREGGEDKLQAITRETGAIGGAATLYRAPPDMKQRSGIYSFPDDSIRCMNGKIKAGFDPHGMFNPGRLHAH